MQDSRNIIIGFLLFSLVAFAGFTFVSRTEKSYAKEPEVEIVVQENGVSVTRTLPLGQAIVALSQLILTIPQATIDMAKTPQ